MEQPTTEHQKQFWGIFEKPWIRRQVETHLFFGLIARHVSFVWVICVLGAIYLCVFVPKFKDLFTDVSTIACYGFGIFLLRKLSKYQQAVIGWFVIKFTLGVVALMVMTVGTWSSLQRGQSDALPNFLLGVIWLPSVEFIPKITPHQKYVTIGRLLLTIPVVYVGIKSGFWHW